MTPADVTIAPGFNTALNILIHHTHRLPSFYQFSLYFFILLSFVELFYVVTKNLY